MAQSKAQLPCSKTVLDLNPSEVSLFMEFACSPCACLGSLWALQLPPTVK